MSDIRRKPGAQIRRRRQRRHLAVFSRHPSQDLAHLWMLRLLVDLGGWRKLFSDAPIDDDAILRPLGVDCEVDGWDIAFGGDQTGARRAVLPELKTQLARLEARPPLLDDILRSNLDVLAECVGLSEVEKELLGFAFVHHTYPPLVECTGSFGHLRSDQVVVLLATALDLPDHSVRKALAPDALLARSCLLTLDRRYSNSDLGDKLDLLPGLAERLMEPQSDVMALLKGFFREASEGTLDCDDFPYMADDVQLLKQYLRPAVDRSLPGANVLFYGLPGTGKSELAKALASVLGCQLMEVAFDGQDDEVLSGKQRLSAYQLCQSVLAPKGDTLVLFDEVEDVFSFDGPALFAAAASGDGSKARVNHILEHNPVPAIWICNSIDDFDNAYLRRFDIVVKFDTPPRSVRRKILGERLAGLKVSERWLDQVAAHSGIAPALVTRAAKVVAVAGSRSRQHTEQRLGRLLEGTLEAMGYDSRLFEDGVSAIPYRLDVLNPDQKLNPIVAGIRKRGRGRLCLYGPPGTGKSELARYLAETTDRPLLVKRASDLLSKWVGDTEKAIAGMFEEAERDDAILLLDEADSFLRDRRGARHSWEVTQVNELLTRMERFQGVFICSTNLMDDMDDASVRRFDLKIRFDWMTPDQAWTLFRQIIKQHRGRMPANTSPWRDTLGQLTELAPGDFATVVRRCAITGDDVTPERLYAGLAEESRFKQSRNGRSIGFTAVL